MPLSKLTRRDLLAGFAVSAFAQGKLTPRERVDRVFAGKEADRPPYSLWLHFGLEPQGPAAHAKATLAFHRDYGTDLVKVMSDFPYPKPAGDALVLKPVDSPFPAQLEALQQIREGLDGSAHFVETLFNPWNVAEKLSSKEEVMRLKEKDPQKLLDALEAIAKSEANHARRAVEAGASGIFLAIANAQQGILTPAEYRKFSEPFDRIVLGAAKGAPLNILHLHGDKVHLDLFWTGWPGLINYSAAETGVPLSEARKKNSGVLIGRLDHRSYRVESVENLRADITRARQEAGSKLIVTPGCSVPNESRPEELKKLGRAIG